MMIHVDMDAFYASVEEREAPHLVGKPVIVGGRPESRGVVSAANYAARKFGVHSAMPSTTAVRLCPQGVFLPPRIELYAQVSGRIRKIFERYTSLIEPLSLDEAFLDVRDSQRLFGPTEEIARRIKADIREQEQLVASVGVAPNKMLAKIASDLDKPDGFVFVPGDGVNEFLDPLPVARVWGVGRVTQHSLERLGVRTIGQLRNIPLETLQTSFGSGGEHLWKLSRGIDDRRVLPDREAKSISHETTFAKDITDAEVLRSVLWQLSDQVARRLRRQKLFGKTVQLKLRYDDFDTITRAQKLDAPTHVTSEIAATADELFSKRLPARQLSVRLIGVGISGLTTEALRQQSLFADEAHKKESQIDSVTDEIRKRYGGGAVGRAIGLRGGEEWSKHRRH